ncbi:MAG: hypothetical protein ACPGQS_10740 [Bradymonadia bacterium]
MNKTALRTLLLLFIVLLGGCGAADHQRLLNKRVYAYNQQLRWSLMDSAQKFVTGEFRDQWRLMHLNSRKNVKLVSVESQLTELTRTQPPEAEFSTKITWYIEGDMRVQHSVWSQRWAFRENRWLLVREENVDGATGLWP